MRKSQLLDLLRSMSAATGERRLIVVGSQSVHGQVTFLPATVLRSIEVDIYIPPSAPASKRIDSDFGPESTYFAAHGVYADTLGPGKNSLGARARVCW